MNLQIAIIFLGTSISAVSGHLRGDIRPERPQHRVLKKDDLTFDDVVKKGMSEDFEEGELRTFSVASRAVQDHDIICGSDYSRTFAESIPVVVEELREIGGEDTKSEKEEKPKGYRVFQHGLCPTKDDAKEVCRDFKKNDCKDACEMCGFFEYKDCDKICEEMDDCFDKDNEESDDEKCCEKIYEDEFEDRRMLEKKDRRLSNSRGKRTAEIGCDSSLEEVLRSIPGWYYEADGDKACEDACDEECDCEDECDGNCNGIQDATMKAQCEDDERECERECERKCEKECYKDLCDCLDDCDFGCGVLTGCFHSCEGQCRFDNDWKP